MECAVSSPHLFFELEAATGKGEWAKKRILLPPLSHWHATNLSFHSLPLFHEPLWAKKPGGGGRGKRCPAVKKCLGGLGGEKVRRKKEEEEGRWEFFLSLFIEGRSNLLA